MANDVFDKVRTLIAEIEQAHVKDMEELETFRIRYLGSKNILKPLMGEIRNVDNARKPEYGQLVNEAKTAAEAKYNSLKAELETAAEVASAGDLDLTAPGEPLLIGARHPISITMNRIVSIFERIGFVVAEGPEIEDDWHNFTALNTPEDHPARDMQDTYYLKGYTPGAGARLLRTHTSSVQARVMKSTQPPIRIIAPGRVYRNETISARSHAQFHQVEGLYIDEGVSFADMQQTLFYFAQEMYGATKIRLRPSYFPFTEPSAEMDVYWGLETEADYRITKGTGWLEILGCGMVDPNVLEECGIDSERYTGFAFGMGIERQAMLRYNITDIRLMFENDVRFLRQFTGAR
ncbi:MAG: phenylalanine--tRNA ligase subunit alpha [Lewinella sp.]|nr:phenylalanine--tRNA ligase subunit alpha [Lewinella sp.]